MQPKKILKRLSELPTMPSTIGTMEWNQTGDWRYLTPVVAKKPAPCRRDCPAGIPISDYLKAINQGDVQKGLALLLAYNPLPGLTGRLCYHPCQTHCARKQIDRSISIREVERLMAELGREVKINGNKKLDTRVTIVGSGPIGLSCAFFLGSRGLRVTILEVNGRAGGALLGLSEKEMEAHILEDEISHLTRLSGIQIETNAAIDFTSESFKPNSDLIILDPTGYSKGSDASPESVPFHPFVDEGMRGDIIAVTLPEKLKTFRASLIAHYIAAGRQTAEKVLARLIKSPEDDIGEPTPAMFLPGGKRESPQTTDSSESTLSIGEGARPEKTEMVERILAEANRCLDCGTCNLCFQCVSSCPEACIRLDDEKNGVSVDLDFCKGCGICAYECPRGIIAMEEVGT